MAKVPPGIQRISDAGGADGASRDAPSVVFVCIPVGYRVVDVELDLVREQLGHVGPSFC
jgi:hypothetical protein